MIAWALRLLWPLPMIPRVAVTRVSVCYPSQYVHSQLTRRVPGTQTPTKFSLFPNLPFELRLKIWNLTIQPRVILCRRRSRPRVPALLQVCRESREEGLRHYQIHYWEPNNKLAVYFSIEHDTLFGTSTSLHDTDYALESLSKNPAISQIHHLAISRSFWERMFAHPIYDDLYYRIRNNKDLKTITVVWHRASVLMIDEPKLVEDEDGGREDGLQTAQDWRLEMQESRADHPEWNDAELTFARVEEVSF